jgi:hypothetical protein
MSAPAPSRQSSPGLALRGELVRDQSHEPRTGRSRSKATSPGRGEPLRILRPSLRCRPVSTGIRPLAPPFHPPWAVAPAPGGAMLGHGTDLPHVHQRGCRHRYADWRLYRRRQTGPRPAEGRLLGRAERLSQDPACRPSGHPGRALRMARVRSCKGTRSLRALKDGSAPARPPWRDVRTNHQPQG